VGLHDSGLAADVLHGQAAGSSTTPTALRANSAVFVSARVLFAFLRADLAGVRAHVEHLQENLLVVTGPPRCQCTGGEANIGAIQIQPNALPQLAGRRLGCAGIRAAQATQDTVITFLDAVDERMTVHAPHFGVRLDDLPRVHFGPLS
jgi:hypothetical protein